MSPVRAERSEVSPSLDLGRQPSLETLVESSPYRTYSYSYPHKTAHRPFEEPVPLDQLWAPERKDAVFLYFHVPFCAARCGFCNLFAEPRPAAELQQGYVDALDTQAERVRAALGTCSPARVAFGGGTPTQLESFQLERLFDIAESRFGASLSALPVSLEVSPGTSTIDRLKLAAERGIDRVSIGVQSFDDAELKAIGRPRGAEAGILAIDRIRSFDFPTLNVDLIFGIPGQSVESWLSSVRTALSFRPEEFFLYPLYVRPLTGLGRKRPAEGVPDWRLALECYRRGRELLLSEGYEQVSMRFFRHTEAGGVEGPSYRCQEDGMVGLGCGARSYTRALHYCDEWAVGAKNVREIIAKWVARPAESFDHAWYGIDLDERDQRHRYVIQSILFKDGLEYERYEERFGTAPFEDFPELPGLVKFGLAEERDARLLLTPAGFERSDSIGPWLYSERVLRRMRDFVLR